MADPSTYADRFWGFAVSKLFSICRTAVADQSCTFKRTRTLRGSRTFRLPRGDGHHVDYGTIIPWKSKILASAFSRFLHTSDKMLLEEYDAFYNANQFWLDDYALFMACKAMHDGKDWLSWEEAYRRPTDSLKKELKSSFLRRYNTITLFNFYFLKNGMH